MGRAPTPEELEAVTEIFKKYRGTQLKLLAKRKQIETLQDESRRAVAELGDRKGPGADLIRAQLRVAEAALRQMKVFDLDGAVYNPPTEADTPAFEARQLELQLAVIDQQLIGHRVLAEIVRPDLARLAAGEPAPRGLPEAWLAERAALGDAERRSAWERFAEAQAALEKDRAAQSPPTPGPSPERLAWLRKAVPALRGAEYRVASVLRQLPTGEAVLKDVRDQLVADLKLTGKGPGAKRTAMTDRLRDMFRPPGK